MCCKCIFIFSISLSQLSDPVYVFMTLENSNNPEGNVFLPNVCWSKMAFPINLWIYTHITFITRWHSCFNTSCHDWKSAPWDNFRREMTSSNFPDRVRSCEIGPISAQLSSHAVNRDSCLTTTWDEIIRVESAEPKGDCMNTCTSFSSTMVFYLTVSTAAEILLAFIFFITTIFMCCKHHYVSSNVGRSQRYVTTPPSQVSDPVYVSLSRRNTNERVYMTLEDPNNPEGKVLLPKEVFDEFYNRTLTLRKT